MNKTVTVLGAGAFGTSFATLLANNGFNVNLWCNEEEVVKDILKYSENKRYLSDIKLDKKIKPTTDLKSAIKDSEFIFEAIPVKFLRSVLVNIKDDIKDDQIFVVLSKGIENKTLFLSSQIVADVFGKNIKCAAVSGPNFARELAEKKLTACVVASLDQNLSQTLAKFLSNNYFKTYISQDFIGTQVAGALKNVLTVLIGIAKGADLAQNSLAFLLTMGFAELKKVVVAFGGEEQTAYGLAGLGDLILCTEGNLSRNLLAGKLLGTGASFNDLQKEFGTMPESINSVQSMNEIMKKYNLDLPLFDGLYKIMFEKLTFDKFLQGLMGKL